MNGTAAAVRGRDHLSPHSRNRTETSREIRPAVKMESPAPTARHRGRQGARPSVGRARCRSGGCRRVDTLQGRALEPTALAAGTARLQQGGGHGGPPGVGKGNGGAGAGSVPVSADQRTGSAAGPPLIGSVVPVVTLVVVSAAVTIVRPRQVRQLPEDLRISSANPPKPRQLGSRVLIGWREWLALPDIGIPGIKAKIDTGARSSALHTHDYEVEEVDGQPWVRFHLHPLVHRPDVELRCRAEVVAFREVKDSGGHVEQRPFIRTHVVMAGIEWPVLLSLTNRESMKFRMLLGRTAMAGRFAVDAGLSYVVSRSLSQVYP